MKVIKRLHLFILKSFLPLFAMTFFIVLFIVLMQFLWRYIDDLVGKGLSLSVIGELFFYAAVCMIPMALPLAILLASLMTFGNLGERFELTAMKAAGISLIRVMAPLIFLIASIAVGAFFFQNDILPKAQVKMWTLLFSMRQKSPEVEIPTGVFYDQIPGINLYVKEKNRETGMLYDVKIYDVRHGGENVTILVSDSARMALTEDMQYIYLFMDRGYQYERMTPNSTMQTDPFRRESFYTKQILIPFDANFNRMDEGGMREQYVGKNIAELQATIDSINYRLDSIGERNSEIISRQLVPSMAIEPTDKNQKNAVKNENKRAEKVVVPISVDSLMATLDPSSRSLIITKAVGQAEQKKNSVMFESETTAQEKKIMRRHGIELLKKFTLSVACIIFFFIGAPLGAIIRKGGIGMPLVISVLLFLVYYIFDNTGYKMARDGHASIWFGMWLSTFILAPLGIFVTYKAMHDSAVFDPDRIKMFFRKVLRRREERSVTMKEVIINDISTRVAQNRLVYLSAAAYQLLSRLKKSKGLAKWIVDSKYHDNILEIANLTDEAVEYLHDSRDKNVISHLSEYPVIQMHRFMTVRELRKDLKKILDLNSMILHQLKSGKA